MIIISFLLDGLVSNYFSFLVPLFTLVSIVVSSYYIKFDDIIKRSIIIGIIYDVVYTDTVILNAIIFFFLSILIYNINKRFNKKLINLVLINFFIIILYLVITYLILVMFNYLKFNFIYLLFAILKSILINTIYLFILYFINRHKKIIYEYD